MGMAALFKLLMVVLYPAQILTMLDSTENYINHFSNENTVTTENSREILRFMYFDSICNLNNTCHMIQNVSSTDRDLRTRNCMCDLECKIYGDCCLDSKYYDLKDQNSFFSYSCFEMSNENESIGHIYIKTSCPSSWNEFEISTQCERSKNITEQIDDMTVHTPATSLVTNITYGNVFCALCNQETELKFWNLGFQFLAYEQINDVSAIYENLFFNQSEGLWMTTVGNKSVPGALEPLVPTTVQDRVRFCLPNVISSCSSGLQKKYEFDRCNDYTSAVFQPRENDQLVIYRNKDCALCNNETEHLKGCIDGILRSMSSPRFRSFSLIFDPKSTIHSNSNFCSNQNSQAYAKLHRYLCQENSTTGFIKGNECQISNFKSKNISILENEIVYIPVLDKNFSREEYQLYSNGSVDVCVKVLEDNATFLGITSAICLSISIICLIAHLSVFFILQKLRNLSGKNLASLSLALLAAYFCFVASGVISEKSCILMALLTYYFLLVSFFWMLTISFDVWRSMWLAVKELRSTSGRHNKKFFFFSIFSWLVPAFAAIFTIYVEKTPLDSVWAPLKPNFGTNEKIGCWFGNETALLVFFITPFGVIMALNFTFFCSAAYLIYSSKSNNISSRTKADFRLYMRLALLMGVTWMIAFVAKYLKYQFLWLIFILLNANQGILIFIAFTCKKEILDELLQACRSCGKINGRTGGNVPQFSNNATTSTVVEFTAGKSN